MGLLSLYHNSGGELLLLIIGVDNSLNDKNCMDMIWDVRHLCP